MLLAGLAVWASSARAQSVVGAGPLTSGLADTEPTTGVLSWGPFKVAPGLTISEMGWDSNVFDEAENPKEDYVVAGKPDAAVFSRTRFVKLSAYAGADLRYQREYATERSVGFSASGRIDVLLSRVRPFVGVGRTKARQRANGEIDARADLTQEEIGGGVAFELGAYQRVFAAATQTGTRFQDALQGGVDLEQSLTRYGNTYSAGLQTDLTPLTSFTVQASYQEDVFRFDPVRNANTRAISGQFKFQPQAALSGVLTVGFEDFRPSDPLVRPFQGATASVAVVVPFLEIGRFFLGGSRSTEYSFNSTDAYYVNNSATLTYTHRLLGDVDAQVTGSRSRFEYGRREGATHRTDTLDTLGGSLGYNLPNRTRVGLHYEYARRRSPALAARNFDRRRVYLAWVYAF